MCSMCYSLKLGNYLDQALYTYLDGWTVCCIVEPLFLDEWRYIYAVSSLDGSSPINYLPMYIRLCTSSCNSPDWSAQAVRMTRWRWLPITVSDHIAIAYFSIYYVRSKMRSIDSRYNYKERRSATQCWLIHTSPTRRCWGGADRRLNHPMKKSLYRNLSVDDLNLHMPI